VRLLLRRKAPTANIHELDHIDDLLETPTMLEQTIERWFEEATRKGLQEGEQKGRQEGERKGKLEGLQEGLARAVALQVQLRFGAVPPWAQARLDAADEAQLLAWTAAILTATSLQDLFGQT